MGHLFVHQLGTVNHVRTFERLVGRLVRALLPINSYWLFTKEKKMGKRKGGNRGKGILTKHFPFGTGLGS